jgi:hypothetical protein
VPRFDERGAHYFCVSAEHYCASRLGNREELKTAALVSMIRKIECGDFTFRPHFLLVRDAFSAYRARITRNNELENCMRKAVFAGAVALAMVGPLLVSEHGLGVAPAAAQEVNLTEGHIYRLKAALRLRAEQLAHWAPVEAALRAAIRSGSRGEEANNDGLVQNVRARVKGYAVQVSALRGAYAAAGPLIASLDESQKRAGAGVIRALGGSAAF